MTFDTIDLTTDPRGVATLTLNRPEKHNVLSARMIAELTKAATQLGEDASVRTVILTGAGVSFCAGGDLTWMKEQMAATRETRMAEARKLAIMLKALNEMPKPLIGRINGQAYGGGVGLMSVCDVAVGVEDTKFGLTETRLGLIPATISPYVMARMGEGLARQVLMSSRRFGAEEAVRLNLLARAVSTDTLDEAIEAETAPYIACSPEAVARTKRLTRRMGLPITEDLIEWTIEQLADTWETADAVEGVSAFFEKRKATWVI
ncbi:MAG: crotonase/enoyl-CoA hydratase family protein [Pseudomonadota bacterium]